MFEGMGGAELAAALARVDVRALDAAAALDYAVAASRLAAWATAGEAAGLARTHALYPDPDPGPEGVDHGLDRHRAAVAEVRAAYGCSRLAASARIGFADALADLPRLASALAEGRLPIDHVRVLVRETEPLLADA
ncbi:MAG TPA: DUF222 domain-containing protein, partial [Jiangellales bacterium]|nr:DUF222 domain-containing protein [Jiangellales bacterium]